MSSGAGVFLLRVANGGNSSKSGIYAPDSEVNRELREALLAEEGLRDTSYSISQAAASVQGKGCKIEPHKAIHDQSDMSTTLPPTREEISARLESIEAKMDARIATMASKLDSHLAEMQIDRVRSAHIEQSIAELKGDVKEGRREVRTVGVGIGLAVVASAIGIYFGVDAANKALVQSTQSSFSIGKELGSSFGQAAADIKQTQEQLRALQERLEKQVPVSSGQEKK